MQIQSRSQGKIVSTGYLFPEFLPFRQLLTRNLVLFPIVNTAVDFGSFSKFVMAEIIPHLAALHIQDVHYELDRSLLGVVVDLPNRHGTGRFLWRFVDRRQETAFIREMAISLPVYRGLAFRIQSLRIQVGCLRDYDGPLLNRPVLNTVYIFPLQVLPRVEYLTLSL